MAESLSLRWTIKASLATILSVAICCLGVTLLFFYQSIRRPVDIPERFLIVEPGEGLSSVADQFVAQGLSKSRWPVMGWGLLSGVADSLQAGEYLIESKTTPAEILGKISRGEIFERKVTIIEGVTFRDFLKTLKKAQRLRHVLDEMSVEEIAMAIDYPHSTLEGSFFPATYNYRHNESDLDLLSRAARKMSRERDAIWEERIEAIAIQTPQEAVILASIIQKEAMLESEMPTISGVLHNRLKKGMRLQVDPTVIYGLGPGFKGKLRRKHLKMDTPYNTYTRDGLPPGPIASPGRAALRAAVQPEETEYLYFVAKGDGSHFFSRTLEEHNRAVKKYIR